MIRCDSEADSKVWIKEGRMVQDFNSVETMDALEWFTFRSFLFFTAGSILERITSTP